MQVVHYNVNILIRVGIALVLSVKSQRNGILKLDC